MHFLGILRDETFIYIPSVCSDIAEESFLYSLVFFSSDIKYSFFLIRKNFSFLYEFPT